MGQLDALKMVKHVKRRLVDLAVSENYLRDKKVSDAARNVWAGPADEGGLVSELWVEGAFPGKQSTDSLKSLGHEGIFPIDLCQHLDKRDVFPADRRLFNHQSEAIRKAVVQPAKEKPALVITAGTGLGKTEAFLLPMLSDLWLHPDRKKDGGMRCLILYPMNALVADQVTRIYEWVQGQQRLTIFHFTSETPENKRWADRQKEPEWEYCRMRTRQEARGRETHDGIPINQEPYGTVPDIVITNYSMLEYMLCRPQDTRFFGPDLRCIILDEAHLYSGTLAAEIMMLLRRVKERCGVYSNQILHIATSATLGGDNDTLRDFAASFFSTKHENTYIIRGETAEYDFGNQVSPSEGAPTAEKIAKYVDVDFNTLTANDELIDDDMEQVNNLCGIVSLLVSESTVKKAAKIYPGNPASFLHFCLQQAPLIRELAQILSSEKGNVQNLKDLSNRLFNSEQGRIKRNACIALLRLAASARLRAFDLPLVPHRLHFLVRAPEGLSVCLNKNCAGPDDYKIPSIGCLQPVADRCRYCEHILLPVHRCNNCGEWALAAHENQELSALEPGYFAESDEQISYYLLKNPQNEKPVEVVIDPQKGEKRGFGAAGISLWMAPYVSEDSQKQQCPTCASNWFLFTEDEQQPHWLRTCQSLVGGRPFALSVTAETVLYDLPEFTGNSRHWKPAGGRRLLAFSDSRASAARLGPLLTQQHEMQLIRAAIARCVQALVPAKMEKRLLEDIERLKNESSVKNIDPIEEQFIKSELRDKEKKLLQAKAGTAFVDFAAFVAKREEIKQILDRKTAEAQFATTYGQSQWKENTKNIQGQFEGIIAKELEKPLKMRATVESVGLVEIVYPGLEKLEIPPLLEEKLALNIRKKMAEIWPEFVAMLLDSSRRDGCVAWSEEKEGRKWLDASTLTARWLTRTRAGWGATVFVGATENQIRRKFTANVLKAAGCDINTTHNLSEQVLLHVFDQLFRYAGNEPQNFSWLRIEKVHQTGHEDDDKAIQILFDKLSVRNPQQLFRCDATGTIWTHSVLDWAPIEGCIGTLRSTSAMELDHDIRWGRSRREFFESKIFSVGLWAEEHSAQLSPQENRRLQDLFKKGIRNILSSTTTMELGIDIGGLNGVLLGNVPPGPANHRQRAGRAGRRSDGSAVVVTYTRDSEFNREVFRRFGEFLGKEMRNPTVLKDRDRLIYRHLYAVLLSDFFRSRQPESTGAMQAFGRMGTFCGFPPIKLGWSKASEPKPPWPHTNTSMADEFVKFLNQIQSADLKIQSKIVYLSEQTGININGKKNGWPDLVNTAKEVFIRALDDWNEEIQQLKDAWNEKPSGPQMDVSREMSKANQIRYMVQTLTEITVIEWLADHRFLPRYGFPINLQQLTIKRPVDSDRKEKVKADERYRLERSSLLALSEYVPGSSVLVGGRIATSRGLKKHWTDANLDKALGLLSFSLECQEGHIYLGKSLDEPCPRCGGKPNKKQQLVFPRYGYTTAGWDNLPLGTNLERIGEQSVCPTGFAESNVGEIIENFAGISNARITYREEAPLLVRNEGQRRYGFAICTRCGFAMSENSYGNGRMRLPRSFESHASIFSTNVKSYCWQKNEQQTPVLRNKVLAAKELTDMLLLEWPGATSTVENGVYSLGRALILAGTRLLELDGRELGMELFPLRCEKMGIVIYDTTPGGAGHCQELIKLEKQWLDAARNILYVNVEHHARCKKACLDCILDFSGQYKAYKLDRKEALKLFDKAVT